MKRLTLLFAFLLGIMVLPLMAQDQDPWVGEWTSEAYSEVDWERTSKDSDDDIIYAQYKKVIKITSHGNSYMVRIKIIKVDDPNYISYSPPLNVTSFNGETMVLTSHVEKKPFTVNGKVDSYSDITYYTRLTLSDGVLYYHFYKWHSVNYNRHMRYTNEEDYYLPSTGSGTKLRLFNDNW